MGGSFPKYINNVGGFFSAVGQTFCYKTHFTKAFLPARHLAAAGVVCASVGVLECVGVLESGSVAEWWPWSVWEYENCECMWCV